jgi:hypothetical protein
MSAKKWRDCFSPIRLQVYDSLVECEAKWNSETGIHSIDHPADVPINSIGEHASFPAVVPAVRDRFVPRFRICNASRIFITEPRERLEINCCLSPNAGYILKWFISIDADLVQRDSRILSLKEVSTIRLIAASGSYLRESQLAFVNFQLDAF